MATQRTLRIDVTNLLPDKDKASIRLTCQESAKVFEFFAKLSVEHRTTSYKTLHKYGYEEAKKLSPTLPTALLQQTARQALFCVKSFNTQHKKRKWEYPGTKKKASYPLNKLSLNRRGDLTTFSTCKGRVSLLLIIPDWFKNRYTNLKLQAGFISVVRGRFYLSLTFMVDDIEPTKGQDSIGMDRGLYNVVALSDGTIIPSKHIHAVKRRYAYTRKTCQAKGTRASRKRMKARSGREKRFMADVNHCISKMLAARLDVLVYILEDLTGIRDKKHGKKMNRWLSNWAFFQFQTFLAYKCARNGMYVYFVDPRYTSQTCSACGKRDKNARKKGIYKCKRCGHIEHADINAAKNIRDKFLARHGSSPGRLQSSGGGLQTPRDIPAETVGSARDNPTLS